MWDVARNNIVMVCPRQNWKWVPPTKRKSIPEGFVGVTCMERKSSRLGRDVGGGPDKIVISVGCGQIS